MMAEAIEEAVERLRRGELVAYPTETLFGLGADATQPAAVARLQRWKGRAEDQPLSLLVAGVEDLAALGVRLSPAARRLAEALWPGPLTLVASASRALAPGVARKGDGALGLRCSSHPVAAALARRLSQRGVGPVTATSLNPSGQPAAASHAEAARLCAPDGPWLLEVRGAPEPAGAASTVVDVSREPARVLRHGAVSPERLAALLGAEATA
jgi:L-threonylcarbamoyladenylate synthase